MHLDVLMDAATLFSQALVLAPKLGKCLDGSWCR